MTYDQALIAAPLEKAREMLAQLTVSPSTLRAVEADCERADVSFTADFLRKEWVNEAVAQRRDPEAWERATASPDIEFMRYALMRINNPQDPSGRQVVRLMQDYSLEFITYMHRVRWPQEIAWAERLRGHPNDETVMYAWAFLKMVRKNATSVFTKMVGFAHSHDPADPGMRTMEYTDMSPDEIRSIREVTDAMDPLCIQLMRRNRESGLSKMTEAQLKQAAKRIRSEYLAENLSIQQASAIGYLQDYPLTLRFMILNMASRKGISSSCLVQHYERFIDAIREGKIDVSDFGEIEHAFADFLDENADEAMPSPPKARLDAAKTQLAAVNSRWLAALPDDMKTLGAERKTKFTAWRDAILTGDRASPLDLRVDYCIFLLENP